MNILDEIVADITAVVKDRKQRISQESLLTQISELTPPLSFSQLFTGNHGSIIAEIKPKSPSKGVLMDSNPLKVAELYQEGHAGAVSVLTNQKYFNGSDELFRNCRSIIKKPILRKEFIVDEYQIFESCALGADAILLIARILETHQMRHFRDVAKSLGMDALVEVHDEADTEKALEIDADLIGINNRNLDTLEISLKYSEQLSRRIPSNTRWISESGIETADDVKRVCAMGARGILVGTSILQSPNPLQKLEEFFEALQ